MELKFLKKKEVKDILKKIEKRFGITKLKLDYAFLKSSKGKIYIISKDVSKIDLNNLRIDSLGMYFCRIDDDGIRLSIEGSQLIGKYATKNIIILNDKETKKWFSGEVLEKEGNGYVLLKNKDFIGCSKIVNGKLYNYVPKERRI